MSSKKAQPNGATPIDPTPTDLPDDPLASEQIPDLAAMINEINAEHFAKIAALEAQIAELKKQQQPAAKAADPVDDQDDEADAPNKHVTQIHWIIAWRCVARMIDVNDFDFLADNQWEVWEDIQYKVSGIADELSKLSSLDMSELNYLTGGTLTTPKVSYFDLADAITAGQLSPMEVVMALHRAEQDKKGAAKQSDEIEELLDAGFFARDLGDEIIESTRPSARSKDKSKDAATPDQAAQS